MSKADRTEGIKLRDRASPERGSKVIPLLIIWDGFGSVRPVGAAVVNIWIRVEVGSVAVH